MLSVKVEERYQNDVAFHAMVDMMRHYIEQLALTPSEVREASMLACFQYEQRRFRYAPLAISVDAKDDALARLRHLQNVIESYQTPCDEHGLPLPVSAKKESP